MRILFVFFLLTTLFTPLTANNFGWNIGAGIASSDRIGNQSTPPFPFLRTEQKQFMLIPAIRYQAQQWSLGTDGLGWQSEENNAWQWDLKAGFPVSYLAGSGQQGWFRYGARSEFSNRNGWVHKAELTAGPVQVSDAQGLWQRAGDRSRTVSLGAPVYINSQLGMTVIGKAGLRWDNAPYLQNEYELTARLRDTWYQQTVLSVVAVWQVSEQITLLGTAKLQWNDEQWVKEVESVADLSANTFLLFSYAFGR